MSSQQALPPPDFDSHLQPTDPFRRPGGLLTVLLLALAAARAGSACERVFFGKPSEQNIACKCTETHCNDEPLKHFNWPTREDYYVRLVSDRSGRRFETSDESYAAFVATSAAGVEVDRVVEVDVNSHRQQILGYGGALTDSAAMLIGRLPPKLRSATLSSYFGPNGLDYNLVRVPIGGTDMSSRPYSNDELERPQEETDFELERFSLQEEDLLYKLPILTELGEQLAGGGKQLRLVGTSWSAPNWMKSHNSLVQGQLKGEPDGPYYAAYARYMLRFLAEYERRLPNNTRFWALTPQNEPCTPSRVGISVIDFNSVNFSPKQLSDFVRLHLIPQLIASGRTKDKLALFLWDDTLLGMDKYLREFFADSTILDFARGVAVHWYSQALDKLPYKSLYEMRRAMPSKFSLLSTEASFIGRPKPGAWARGASYARDIIENLRAGAVGWIDWNLALNTVGGPTWSENFLDAPLLIDEQAATVYRNPMFYAIGQVSGVLRPGARVLTSQVRRREEAGNQQQQLWRMVDEFAEQTSDLLVAAAELERDEDAPQSYNSRFGRKVGLVMLNRSASKLRVRLQLANCRHFETNSTQVTLNAVELSAESITSFAFNC